MVGSEQGGIRPVLIIQNDTGNRYSPTVIAAAITSQINKAKMPTHITVGAPNYGLTKDSIILTEQIRTLDKRRLREKTGSLDEKAMRHVDESTGSQLRTRLGAGVSRITAGESAYPFMGYALFAYRLGFAVCGRQERAAPAAGARGQTLVSILLDLPAKGWLPFYML